MGEWKLRDKVRAKRECYRHVLNGGIELWMTVSIQIQSISTLEFYDEHFISNGTWLELKKNCGSLITIMTGSNSITLIAMSNEITAVSYDAAWLNIHDS